MNFTNLLLNYLWTILFKDIFYIKQVRISQKNQQILKISWK